MTVAIVVAAAFGTPTDAVAATTCELSSGVLDVTMSADDDRADLAPEAGTIFVDDGVASVTCAGATPTVNNTNTISIHNQSAFQNHNIVRIFKANQFAPGATVEAAENGGTPEIEIFVNLNGAANSYLQVAADTTGVPIFFGTGGINPNATVAEVEPDADITPNNVPLLRGVGNSGNDFINAQGGRGTGNPLPVNVELDGNSGNDNIGGGEGNDIIDGRAGNDDLRGNGGNDSVDGGGDPNQLSGGAGEDFLVPGTAGDFVEGGDGMDVLDYFKLTTGVTLELQPALGLETVYGTDFEDTLRGDGAPNVLVGMQGKDVLEGRGGNDTLEGRQGDDSLDVRDGGPDSADCGPDTDTVTADAPGIDTLTACENVVFPTAGGVGSGADGTAADLTGYRLSRSIFAAASKGPSVVAVLTRRKPRVGTTVRYTLSERATVNFTVERAAKGRRVGGRCRKPTRGNRRRKGCTRYSKLKGSFEHAGQGGRNSFKFTGRLRGRKLRPGRYRLLARANDAAGNRSKPRRVKFRIVKR